jgi:membrane fusion protein (multidrug efflux system)
MSEGDFIIEEGLKPGDQVIVNGLQKVRPSAPVKAVEWNPAGNAAAPNAPAAPAAPEKK